MPCAGADVGLSAAPIAHCPHPPAATQYDAIKAERHAVKDHQEPQAKKPTAAQRIGLPTAPQQARTG